jgi:AcrR family transcriptional regulator
MSENRGLGRPRDASLDAAVIAATQRQLADVGFAQMSIEAIATEAGVTRPTLYRRWSTKEDLAIAAIAALVIDRPAAATDDTWGSVRAELVHFRRSLERPNGMSMIGMVLLEEQRLPRLAALFRSHLVEPRRARLIAMLRAGIERGDVRRDADLPVAVAAAIGSFYAHYIATGSVPKNWERTTLKMLRSLVATATS